MASQGNSQGNLPSTVGELSTIYFDDVVVRADLIFLISKTVFDFTGTFRSVAGSTSMLVGKKTPSNRVFGALGVVHFLISI